jgi:hypothetical protein
MALLGLPACQCQDVDDSGVPDSGQDDPNPTTLVLPLGEFAQTITLGPGENTHVITVDLPDGLPHLDCLDVDLDASANLATLTTDAEGAWGGTTWLRRASAGASGRRAVRAAQPPT